MASSNYFFPEDSSITDENLDKLLKALYDRCGQHCMPKSLTIATLLTELGYLFRMKQLWLKCPCLVELTCRIGLFTDFQSDSAAIDCFISEAKNSELNDLLYKWIDNSDYCTSPDYCATPDNPSHTYNFLD